MACVASVAYILNCLFASEGVFPVNISLYASHICNDGHSNPRCGYKADDQTQLSCLIILICHVLHILKRKMLACVSKSLCSSQNRNACVSQKLKMRRETEFWLLWQMDCCHVRLPKLAIFYTHL